MGPMKKHALKAGAVMFAVSLAGQAVAAGCARPQDMAALKTAALQQQLMVAAYMCHSADAYNRFVLSNQGELLSSDRAVMEFFVRQDPQRGADDYNAFKTKLANSSSLNSQHNSKFCRNARAVFAALLDQKVKLTELVATRAPGFESDYMRCAKAKTATTLAAVETTMPQLPQRREPLVEAPPASPQRKDAEERSFDNGSSQRDDAEEEVWDREEGYDEAYFDERDAYDRNRDRYRDDRYDEEAYDRDFYDRRGRGFYTN
jgi:hypothetical protein